ncbi:MAG: TIGR02186 family protein [Acidobacteria bacterium]|nr:TIGR02186 family protein [Acidobacteriota bacterium]
MAARRVLPLGTILAEALFGMLLPLSARASVQGFSAVEPSRVEAGSFYSGATLRLHGLVHPDSDVLVLLVGQTEPEVFNRRERTWIIWGGVEHVTVEEAPSCYLLITSGALPAIAQPRTRERLQLGLPTLADRIQIHPPRPDSDLLIRDFVRLKQREGLYQVVQGGVELSDIRQGRREFDAKVRLPLAMEPGPKELEVLELSGGELVGRDVHTVELIRVGMPAHVSAFAESHPALFGALSAAVMLLTGLLIGLLGQTRRKGEVSPSAVIGRATLARVLQGLRIQIGQPGEPEIARKRAKFGEFQTLLTLNNEVLGLLSELEEESSWTSFRHARVRMAIRALLDGTMDMVRTLNRLADDRYFDLETVVSSIRKEVTAFLEAPPREDARLTIALGKIRAEDEGEVGGKASSLARLECDLGLRVPPSYVVTIRAYREFLESTGLADRLRAILAPTRVDDPKDLGSRSGQARACIEETPIPPSVEQAIHAAARELTHDGAGLAVRSSAVGEDGKLSFAGQFESLLNVPPDEVPAAWKHVVSSRFLPRAIFYRRAAGIAEVDVPMAVLVQRMVQPLASGVLYTRRPDRPREPVLLISAAWGIGRDVSGGSADADQWVVSRHRPYRVLERRVTPKLTRLVADSGGRIDAVPLAEAERSVPSLTDAQIAAVAGQAIEADRYFGGALDIEWALERDGSVVLLQARPLRTETSRASAARAPDDAVVLLEGGQPVAGGRAVGPAWTVSSPDQLDDIPQGVLLVLPRPTSDAVRVLPRLCGVIVERGSVTSHMASVLREFRVPSLFGLEGAVEGLEPGRLLSLDVAERKVFDGAIWPQLRGQTVSLQVGGRPGGLPESLAERLTTLSGGVLMATWTCRSLHDVVRFCHEMAIQSMFDIGDDLARARHGGVKVLEPAPRFPVRLIDLGGGLTAGLDAAWKVAVDQVVSVPFLAVWEGLSDDRFDMEQHGGEYEGSFGAIARTAAFEGVGERALGAPSYVCVTSSYMNLNSRQAYHFAIVDAHVGPEPDSNHIGFRLKGGGAPEPQRILRVRFMADVLRMHHFAVSERGDLLNAWQRGLDVPASRRTLTTVGRLLRFCARLDMRMARADSVPRWVTAFAEAEESADRQGTRSGRS